MNVWKDVEFNSHWGGRDLIIIAGYGRKPSYRIGEAKGEILGNGIGFLGDIRILPEIEMRGWLFGFPKRTISLRGSGIGSRLLESYEREMATRGVEEIRGNLVPDTPDKLGCLVGWYRKRGYEFYPGEMVAEMPLANAAGMISKKIHF